MLGLIQQIRLDLHVVNTLEIQHVNFFLHSGFFLNFNLELLILINRLLNLGLLLHLHLLVLLLIHRLILPRLKLLVGLSLAQQTLRGVFLIYERLLAGMRDAARQRALLLSLLDGLRLHRREQLHELVLR